MNRFGKTGVAIGLAVTMLMTPVQAGTVMAVSDEVNTSEEVTEDGIMEEISTNEPEKEDKESEGELTIDATHFPDVGFRNYVLEYVDQDKNERLSQEELDARTGISVKRSQIQSLAGIEYFTKLEELSCDNNRLSSLDVSRNLNLKMLCCDNNQLSSLDVSSNPKLYWLFCSRNRLSRLDVGNNQNLGFLNCALNPLGSIDLRKNANLVYLIISYRTDMALDLSHNEKLDRIYLFADAQNQVLDFTKITGLQTDSLSEEGWNSTTKTLQLAPSKFVFEEYTLLTPAYLYKLNTNIDRYKLAICTMTDNLWVTKLTLDKTRATMVNGTKLVLKPAIVPTNATNKKVTWTSSNTKVAKVDSEGKVAAVGGGSATITCKAADGSGKMATCKIKVYTNIEAFVARIYTKALGRQPETAGLAYWTNQIQTKKMTPVQVAEAFFFAPEFTNKKLSNTEFVKVLYRTFMGREADKEGLDYWVGRLNKGEARKVILECFAGCQEFRNIVASFGL